MSTCFCCANRWICYRLPIFSPSLTSSTWVSIVSLLVDIITPSVAITITIMRSCTLDIIHRSFRGNRSHNLIVDRYIIGWTIRIGNTRNSTLCSSSRIVNRICPSNRRSCRQRFPTFKLNKISCISQVCCCFTRIGINGVYFRNRIILIRLILNNKLDVTFVIISTIWCILVIRSYKFTFSNCSFLQALI